MQKAIWSLFLGLVLGCGGEATEEELTPAEAQALIDAADGGGGKSDSSDPLIKACNRIQGMVDACDGHGGRCLLNDQQYWSFRETLSEDCPGGYIDPGGCTTRRSCRPPGGGSSTPCTGNRCWAGL